MYLRIIFVFANKKLWKIVKNSSNNVPLHKGMSCLVSPTVQMLRLSADWFFSHIFAFMSPLSRHEQPRGAGAGGARLPHALPPGVPRVPARDDEALLEERSGWEADLRVPPVLPGGLLHIHRATVPTWREPIACLDSACYVSLRLGADLLDNMSS